MKIDVILDARASAAELAELGRLAESAGIRGVWVSSLLDSRDPFTNLSVLATHTERLLLGAIAVNPFDVHPVRIASALLTLNELADGRARIVIGGGGEALAAVGIEPQRRVRAVAECVDIIKAAASGEDVDYAGELYQVNHLRFGWLGSPPPPVFVGASMEQMLRMAARVADGSMMSDMPVPLAAGAIATLDRALAQHGKQRPGFQTNAFAAWHLYDDAQRAVREARQWLVLRGIFRPWVLSEFLDQAEVDLVMRSADAFWAAFRGGSHVVEGVPDAVLDTMVENLAFAGTIADIDKQVEKLRRFEAVGLGAIALRLYADPAESIRLIRERVVPALA
ncbi:MAG: LLM class flavin-dependent oxidoreductase [Gammaproteobacteria bacterium]|nr:LLM class flavin-dependent oxidoreductase [Gammaproteobacteria bacterium]